VTSANSRGREALNCGPSWPRELTISVVIATRDRPTPLREVVDQVVEQLHADEELIVVDDATSAPAQNEWHDVNARFVRSHGQGPAVARNRGWRVASGDIIAFTDDDVTLDAGWLGAIRAEFACDPRLIAVEGRTVSRPFDPVFEYSVAADAEGCGLTCNVAYRRTTLELLDGFDESFKFAHCEDFDLFTRARRLGHVKFSPAMTVEHHPRQITPGQFARRAGWIVSERRLYAKNPELKPHAWPASWCAVVGGLRWPIATLFKAPDASSVPEPRRLRRALVLTFLWWWHLVLAIPALAVTKP
jgi:glycosyltransferase involved in cell wall biosynthesis